MSTPRIDLRGQWFTKLFALRPVPTEDPRNNLGVMAWYCLCRCGNHVLARTGHLRKEYIRSCGCLRAESCEVTRQRNGRRVGKAKTGFHRNSMEVSEYVRSVIFEEEEYAEEALYRMALTEELKHLVRL